MGGKNFRDLTVYKKAFQLAIEIFEISKTFPKEERYGLTDQIRRSSRTVSACIGEAYRKRQYEAYFVSKSSDADMENTETRVWLDFALAFKYIDQDRYTDLESKAVEVGKLLNHMIENPKKYSRKVVGS
ncbi:four helix bundle protein [Fulvivirgaceae bacterium PWU4]|uniref:Four helix bundle protein n=1 Tax=Chryseosolibacter histidini TaxID=2782349 RepID=A0AAP2DLK4_9BACT|nr:four helix bundle protein [Chryseosolibacter histidini]MBT1698611.1 four helix bundle protein [Chryseosolibacter histidini]